MVVCYFMGRFTLNIIKKNVPDGVSLNNIAIIDHVEKGGNNQNRVYVTVDK